MGRRTAWWRTRPRCGRLPLHARVAAVGAVLVTSAASAVWPAGTAVADTSGPSSYAFAADARYVEGTSGTSGAQLLEAGKSYRSSLPKAAKLYFRLELDDSSNAYVSATAVPRPGDKLALSDGISVSVRDADNHSCSHDIARFGAARSPHPITAWGARTTSPPTPVCDGPGPFYVVVARTGTADSAAGAWDLELTTATEPRLKQTGAAGETGAPTAWDSATPAPVTGEARSRQGGAGFSRAASVRQGVWRAGISPGQTLFYKVPVDWGQQPSATAELAGSHAGSRGYTVGALDMTLYNPVRADVDDVDTGYDGNQKAASLAPVPPVDYANRYAAVRRVNGMRFAGSYYLAVHLSAAVADDFGDGPFELTLRVRVEGAAQNGPAYAGRPVPADAFRITAQDRQAAAEGGAGDGTAMAAVAVGGIGTGTLVLVVLGAWTVVGRRRARAW